MTERVSPLVSLLEQRQQDTMLWSLQWFGPRGPQEAWLVGSDYTLGLSRSPQEEED